MVKLSLAMIVRDEERTLARILNQAKQFCDEMIVVDTGSVDKTVEIALGCGAQVHQFTWIHDFSAARNYSFAQCTGDWIIWFDADDVLSNDAVASFKYIKETILPTTDVNAFLVPYEYAYDDQGRPVIELNRERLVRRSADFKWCHRIHETINLDGEKKIGHFPTLKVEHRTATENESRRKGRNMSIYDMSFDLKTATMHDLFQYAGELQATKQHEKAVEIYDEYLRQYGETQRDNMGERYIVLVKKAECLRLLNQHKKSIETAGMAIAEDPSRAEAYGIIGLACSQLGSLRGAFMSFAAALGGQRPPHGGIVLSAFYSSAIRELVEDCKKQLETQSNPNAVVA